MKFSKVLVPDDNVQTIVRSSFEMAKKRIGAIIVIVVHGLVDVPYFKNDLAVMFWLFLAMVSIIKLEEKNYGDQGKGKNN